MRSILLLSLLFLMASCRYKHFEFDSIEHYRLKMSENEINNLTFKTNELGEKNDLKLLLNEYDLPVSKNLNKALNKFYKKTLLDKYQVHDVEAIYYDGLNTNTMGSKCIPVFRDILIFKQNGSITGISKICFDCDVQYTEDKNGITKEFDNWDFEDLQKILEETPAANN